MQVMTAISLGGVGKSIILVTAVVFAVSVLRARGAGSNDVASAWVAIGQGALLVDVRGEDEFKGGHLEGALNIPHDQVGRHLSDFGSDKARPIVLYCRSGARAGRAKAELERNGFTKVINAGGYDQLKAAKPAK